jgi:hypothetical protein
VNTIERIPRPAARLDRTPCSSRVRRMSAAELLREQDWGTIQAKLTAFAHRRVQKRSWHLAQDLAQTAIGDLIARPQSWDPEKEPLLKHLAKRVIGLAANEWHRKRSSLEVLFGNIGDDDGPDATADGDSLEEVLDRRRVAARFRARLESALAGDEDAAIVVTSMAEGAETPLAIAKESGLPFERIREARRRIFYQAKLIAEEMSDELDAADDARTGRASGAQETEEEEEVER